MGGCSKAVELYWIGMGAALARCSVDGGVTLYSSPSFGPSQRSGCGSAALKFYRAPNAAFNISDGVTRLAVHTWLN